MTHHQGSFIPYNGTSFVIAYLVVAIIVVIIILRTSLEELKFTRLDYYFFMIITLIIAVAIIANILGFGGTISTAGGF